MADFTLQSVRRHDDMTEDQGQSVPNAGDTRRPILDRVLRVAQKGMSNHDIPLAPTPAGAPMKAFTQGKNRQRPLKSQHRLITLTAA